MSTITQEKIAQRAYEIYLARGGQPGCEVDDWLRAEAELRQEVEQIAACAPENPATRPAIRATAEQTLAKVHRSDLKSAGSRRQRVSAAVQAH